MTQLSDIQEHYWRDRYALRDADGNTVEQSIQDTWNRVATAIGDNQTEINEFYGLLEGFKFVPAGRILAGAGAESDKTFYNCYVIPVETSARRHNRKAPPPSADLFSSANFEALIFQTRKDAGADSREAIFDTIGTMVGIMSRGGGVGINWSVLRPKDSYLLRVSGHSSGPVGWMDVASTAVGEVIQGGSRRGAAMFMLDIWHPDVLRFINAKRDNSKITNANISVGVSDKFMKALAEDEDWTFVFPDTTAPEYNTQWQGNIDWWVQHGLPVVEFDTVPARSIWKDLTEAAHASGEPGVIFIDRYNDQSTANGEEHIICVNPCGEQGLGAYSVCNLGAMNLYAYINQIPEYTQHVNDAGETYVGQGIGTVFDWEKFEEDVRTAIRFLDNVIDKTPDYLPETRMRQDNLRRIGLGVMGLADALLALDYRYGGAQAIAFTEAVFRVMKDTALRETMEIAKEKGPAKAWDNEMYKRPYLQEYVDRTERWVYPMRNLFLLTQAPTGTTSLLAGVSSGIEPYFNLRTWREDRTGGRWVYAKAYIDKFGERETWNELADPSVVTTEDVTIDEHIAMQAAVQKYVDSSVSKTINAPADQTVEEAGRAFTQAYYKGLKGIAYYRDGSRDVQVLHHDKPEDTIQNLTAKVESLEMRLALSMATTETTSLGIPTAQGSKCPECEVGEIIYEESCQKCHSCGWSAC